MASDQDILRELEGLELLQALETAQQPGAFERGGTVEQVTRAIGRGATLNLAEEATAGVSAVVGAVAEGTTEGIGQRFTQALEREEARSAEIPLGLDITGGLVGGLATGSVITRAFPAAFSTAPRAIGSAAAGGGIAGFGAGGTLQERTQNAVLGVVTGGILGAVLPPTFRGIVRAWDVASAKFGPATRRAGTEVLRQLNNGGISIQQAKARLAKLGREAVLADIPELRGLAERVAQSGGIGARRAQRILGIRQKKAGQRIVESASEILGRKRTFQETVGQLIEERTALAGPLYDKAYAASIDLTDDLQDVANRIGALNPTIFRDVQRSLAAELGSDLSEATFGRVGRDGRMVFDRAPTVQFWDLVKRRLDDLQGNALRVGQNNRARQFSALADKITDNVDNLTDDAYKAARNAFAGPKKLEEALTAGRNFLRGNTDEIITGIERMTQGEREMFRMGIVQGVQDITESRALTSDQTRRIFDTTRSNRIFQEIFPDARSRRQFKSLILREKEFVETNRILGGSQTFRRQMQAEDELQRNVESIAEGLQGRGGGLVQRAIERLTGSRTLRPERSQALGEALFTQGTDLETVLSGLGAREAGRAGLTELGQIGALGGAVAVTGANPAGRINNR